MKKNLFKNAMHDLRTPISIIAIESEVALQNYSCTEKDLRKVIQSNLQEARKMSKLINDLVKISADAN